MRKHWTALTMAAAAAAAALSGCVVPPTPYQAASEAPRGSLGYRSVKVEDALVRVEFQGNARTALRVVQAYTLYRAAEIAKEEHAPAFSILEGSFDRQILEGTDTLSRADGAGFEAEDVAVSHPGRGDGPADSVVNLESAPIVRTRSYGMPSPPPRPVYVPTYIYMPATPIVLPQRSLLIRLLPAVPAGAEDRVFVTQKVLDQLGPRIIRPGKK